MGRAPIASVELLKAQSNVEPVGTIGMPVRDHMNGATVVSLLGTDWPELPIDKLICMGNVLTLQRNTLVQRMRGDWLLFIDDDMVWDPRAIRQIIASKAELESMGVEVDVLGALCFRRAWPYQPTLYARERPTSGYFNFMEVWDEGFVEVDGTGMAFCLVTKKCFERIAGSPMPDYEERIKYDKHPDFFRWERAMGEDLRFCEMVKEAGGRVFVDTRIEVGHIGEVRVGYKDFLEAIAARGQKDEDERMAVNTPMGLKTLSVAEAKERLASLP